LKADEIYFETSQISIYFRYQEFFFVKKTVCTWNFCFPFS